MATSFQGEEGRQKIRSGVWSRGGLFQLMLRSRYAELYNEAINYSPAGLVNFQVRKGEPCPALSFRARLRFTKVLLMEW